jgi:glycosyltransferase involved in cell wall biosynthesis
MPSLPNVVHILYSGVGGEAGVVFPLAKAGASQANQHAIFYGIEPLAQANIDTCRALGMQHYGVLKQPGLDMAAQAAITNRIVELQPSMVIVHTLSTLPAVLRAKCRVPGMQVVAVEHHPNVLKCKKRWLLGLLALYRADHTVYLTETYHQEIKRKYRLLYRLRARRTHVIGNSLDLSAYPLSQPDPLKPFTVGMQGRMVEAKDFPTLLRAVQLANQDNAKPMHLALAGDGPLRPQIESLATELNIAEHITFHGMLTAAELIQQMGTWSAYAHSTNGETMSISIMEAKACGLPMVVSDAPGVTNFFQHGENGLVVKKGDAQALATALLKLQNDPTLRAKLSANARREAHQRYSSDYAWAAYASLGQLHPSRHLESIPNPIQAI